MAETGVNVAVTTSGASEAAAALDGAEGALEGITKSSGRLEEQFQHRFQHVGLQLFAGDALRASGLGAETRQVVQTLSLAITAMGESFGIASGGIMLGVTALIALYGMIDKVEEHTKTQIETLNKMNKANEEQLTKTNETIASIKGYTDAIGSVPPYLQKWMDAEKELQKAQAERQILGDKAAIDSLNQLIAISEKRASQMKDQIDDERKLIEALKSEAADTVVLGAQDAQLKKLTDAYDKQTMSLKENKAQVAQLQASINLLSLKGTDDLKKMTEAQVENQKQAEEETKAFQKMAEEHVKQLQNIADEDTKRYQKAAELREKNIKEHAVMLNEIEDDESVHNAKLVSGDSIMNKEMYNAGKAMHDTLTKGFGDAVGKMIVEGKSFSDSMKAAFKSMAEQIVSDIARIVAEWAILSAMGFPMGGGGGFLSGVFGMAEGGEVMVDRPTLFLAGEAGQPELVNFTPLSKMGGGGSGGGGDTSIQIGSITTNITSNDSDQIADTVGRKIIERIRGMGELNFTRSG